MSCKNTVLVKYDINACMVNFDVTSSLFMHNKSKSSVKFQHIQVEPFQFTSIALWAIFFWCSFANSNVRTSRRRLMQIWFCCYKKHRYFSHSILVRLIKQSIYTHGLQIMFSSIYTHGLQIMFSSIGLIVKPDYRL